MSAHFPRLPMISSDDNDVLHEECGVFGISGSDDAAAHTALGLHALQHRGQEASGIAVFDGKDFHVHRALGHVGDNFSSPEVIDKLRGHIAIGHNRYATSGATTLRNVQPFIAELADNTIALAHNGNLTNAITLKDALVRRGAIFQSSSDTEVIMHLVAHSPHKDLVQKLADALNQVEGAYSLVAICNDTLIGVRDPSGVRPLVLGRLDEAYILASESCALDIIGAEFIRDVEPGEMIAIRNGTLHSDRPFAPRPRRFCVFEYIYFARPDSFVEGRSVYQVRKAIGAELSQESPADADIVIPIPDSGTPAAIGYAEKAGLPFELGIIRNHYVGRTFIEPTEQIRHLGVRLKHNANRAYIAGKRVILVDDSIVRGTTSMKIVQMMRDAGAREVHMRIASPPTTHSCFYGVDTPERSKLMAAQHDVDEMCRLIGADSLAFISIEGLYRAVGDARRTPENPQYCDACFTGNYPIPLTDHDEGLTGA